MKNKSAIWIFWIELILATIIPFIVWWSITPTNILNSNVLFGLLEPVGLCGSIIIFLCGVPIGIIGIIKAKSMDKLRIATITFSIVNLTVATIEIVMLILIYCCVVFGGVSV